MQTLLSLAALSLAMALTPVHAQEPAKPAPIRTAPDGAKKPAASVPAGAPKLAALSPQNRMKECNKAATGKKGDERKAFMRSCLSAKR